MFGDVHNILLGYAKMLPIPFGGIQLQPHQKDMQFFLGMESSAMHLVTTSERFLQYELQTIVGFLLL